MAKFESLSALIGNSTDTVDLKGLIGSIKASLVSGDISLLEYRVLTGKLWSSYSPLMAYESLVNVYDDMEEFGHDYVELTSIYSQPLVIE